MCVWRDAVKHMMFGFGDEVEPLDETATLMEDMAVEYVHAMVRGYVCGFCKVDGV